MKSDTPDRFLEGAATLGIPLDTGQMQRFSAYAALLLEWNERFNLLGPAAVQALWAQHLLDALTLVLALPGGQGERTASITVLDVGSGAGLPGVPLAIAFPRWQVTLLEATGKKARFLELAARELELANVEVAEGRAEDLAHAPELRESFDLCVARAVAATAALLELTLPFVVLGGSAILYKGLAGLSAEVEQAEPARVLLGAAAPTVIPVALAPNDAHALVRYVKQGRTPRVLPRRTGLPEHRPLDALDLQQYQAGLAAERDRRRGPRRTRGARH